MGPPPLSGIGTGYQLIQMVGGVTHPKENQEIRMEKVKSEMHTK